MKPLTSDVRAMEGCERDRFRAINEGGSLTRNPLGLSPVDDTEQLGT